jgi:GH25 family lysozyme M1 (1,4-beta-N-acetylmuramidase)
VVAIHKLLPAPVAEMVTKLEQTHGRKVIIYTPSTFANENLGPQQSGRHLFITDFTKRSSLALQLAIPKWLSDYKFWHFAESVVDEDLLRGLNIVAFNGSAEQLSSL